MRQISRAIGRIKRTDKRFSLHREVLGFFFFFNLSGSVTGRLDIGTGRKTSCGAGDRAGALIWTEVMNGADRAIVCAGLGVQCAAGLF